MISTRPTIAIPLGLPSQLMGSKNEVDTRHNCDPSGLTFAIDAHVGMFGMAQSDIVAATLDFLNLRCASALHCLPFICIEFLWFLVSLGMTVLFDSNQISASPVALVPVFRVFD